MFWEMLTNVNWWFVIVMTIVSMLLGMIWYGPLFGRLYGKYLWMTEEQMSDPTCMEDRNSKMMPLMFWELVSRFVFFIWLWSWLIKIQWIDMPTINESLSVSIIFFVFFVLTTQISAVLWWTTDKRLIFITWGKMLVDMILAALISFYLF